MLRRLISFSERAGTKIGESRRNFLSHVGLSVLTAAGALMGTLGRSRADSSDGNGLGACYYSSGGIARCEQLNQAACRLINGSKWVAGQPCGLRPALPSRNEDGDKASS
jgi:hypothetical protein